MAATDPRKFFLFSLGVLEMEGLGWPLLRFLAACDLLGKERKGKKCSSLNQTWSFSLSAQNCAFHRQKKRHWVRKRDTEGPDNKGTLNWEGGSTEEVWLELWLHTRECAINFEELPTGLLLTVCLGHLDIISWSYRILILPVCLSLRRMLRGSNLHSKHQFFLIYWRALAW